MRRDSLEFNALYAALCLDIHDFSPRVGRCLPASFDGTWPAASTDWGPHEVAALALAKNLGKKLTDVVSPDAGDRCLLKFLESDESCKNWSPPERAVPPLMIREGRTFQNPAYPGLRATFDAQMLTLLKQCLQDTFRRPTPSSIEREAPGFDGSDPWGWDNVFLLGDIGPGSVSMSEGTSWYEKFYQSPLSYSHPILWEMYRESLQEGSLRALAEDQREGHFGHFLVRGGKYSSVLKNRDTDRSIDIQPSLNMWAQKGIACLMHAFIRQKYGVDVSIQQFVNRELARRGSIYDDIVTIDETEASNRIPWAFVEWALEGTDLLDLIRVSRCREILLPWGEWKTLSMCSGMGNGFTFLLMTAINLAAIEAVYLYRNREFKKLELPIRLDGLVGNETYFRGEYERLCYASSDVVKVLAAQQALDQWAYEVLPLVALPDWGVFGDDIICSNVVYEDLVHLLGLTNAQVNLDKSFSKGSFRESCGGDFWSGTDVRAVYAKTLATPHDIVSLLNRLLVWTVRHDVLLCRTLRLLWSACKKEVMFVPLHESDHAGLRVPFRLMPKAPVVKQMRELSEDYQTRIYPYFALTPTVRLTTLQGAAAEIYGCGIVLSMIRGEMTSSFKHAQVPAAATLGPPPEKESTSPYRFAVREKQVVYEARWCWTSDWNRTRVPLPTAHQMDCAISRQLGLGITK